MKVINAKVKYLDTLLTNKVNNLVTSTIALLMMMSYLASAGIEQNVFQIKEIPFTQNFIY